jgi:hypothetical protein
MKRTRERIHEQQAEAEHPPKRAVSGAKRSTRSSRGAASARGKRAARTEEDVDAGPKR